jgi:hypothetical protein
MRSLDHNTFGFKKGVLELRDGDYDKWLLGQLVTQACANQTTSWLVDSYNIFGAWTNHEHTHIHKPHHGLDLGGAITFPLILFFMPRHRAYIQMSFCPRILKLRVLKLLKLGLLWLWRTINFCAGLQLRWCLKQNTPL